MLNSADRRLPTTIVTQLQSQVQLLNAESRSRRGALCGALVYRAETGRNDGDTDTNALNGLTRIAPFGANSPRPARRDFLLEQPLRMSRLASRAAVPKKTSPGLVPGGALIRARSNPFVPVHSVCVRIPSRYSLTRRALPIDAGC